MMRKKIVSLCMALALCLGLLPVTALAVDTAPRTLYVGSTTITAGYWTSSDGGTTWTNTQQSDPPSGDSYIHYNGQGTLELHNATIQGGSNTGSPPYGAGIYALCSQDQPVALTIELIGTNTITGYYGIYVNAEISENSNGTDASLTITGENNGSLEVSGSNHGIFVKSGTGNASLNIKNVAVTSSTNGDYAAGVCVQSSANATGSPNISLSVNGGSLTASGGTSGDGIQFVVGSHGVTSATTSLSVTNNAIVDARNGGISADGVSGKPNVNIGSTDSTGGIVFDGTEGTVYGKVELQEDLEIGEGESLTIPDGASLTIGNDATLINEGTVTNNGTLTNNGKIENSGTLTGTISGNAPPSITTPSLTDGTVGAAYTATLAADGEPTSWTWSAAAGSSTPPGLTLNNDGTITGTPTAAGTYSFTVTATNDYGSDSKEFTLTIDQQGTIHVTSVSLDKTSLELTEGNTAQLTATVLPDNATNKNVTWSSDNPSVATVNNGVVSAVSEGTATITVAAQSDNTKSATCTVTVTAAPVPVSGVSLNKDSLALGVGDTETLTATVAPANATNQNVTWASSDTSVATVDSAGKVTAVAPGTATITVTTQDGNHTAACTVTVSSYLPPANSNYKITVEATQGGTVTADPTAAKAGATVTLTPAPDAGYQVGTVAVTDRFGEAVAVTENADGTYVFTMPNGQVTVTVTFEETPLPFTDVMEGDWFYDAVVYAYETGLMDGVGDNLFAPNSQTTRAQLVTILYRLAGQPAVSGDLPFTDVESGTWYTDAVLWAAQNGIVNGVSDTQFAPGDDLTRQQLVTIFYRYAESKGYDVSASADLSGYPDAGQVQDYAQPAMAWAVAEGIVEGMDGTLNPTGDATRAQIATILMRFCEGVAK